MGYAPKGPVDTLRRPGALRLALLMAVAIAAVSWGSILTRLAAAPALAVAAYRVLWGTALFAPFALLGPVRELAPLRGRERAQLLLSGTALALHFALWIASLDYTSVSSSVVLVDTTPFFVGLAGRWLLGAPPRPAFWLGLTLALGGCLVIFHDDLRLQPAAMHGNLLALGGALAMAVYFLVGASARRRLSLVAYVWPVYAVAAAVLVLACLLLGAPLSGFPASSHLYLFLLGLVPQCIGHTTYNWSLRWLPPSLVALVSLAEPIGASLLAYWVLGESLTWEKGVGGAVILAGIWVATRRGEA
jgi:drug/metabolite transporter (DMT)-like permease